MIGCWWCEIKTQICFVSKVFLMVFEFNITVLARKYWPADKLDRNLVGFQLSFNFATSKFIVSRISVNT